MAGKKLQVPRVPWGLILWAGLSVLLAAGMATTVIDLLDVPKTETLRANRDRQHAVIDPVTGAVSIGMPDDAAEHTGEQKSEKDAPAQDAAAHPEEAAKEPAATAATPEAPHPAEPAATKTESTDASTAPATPAEPAAADSTPTSSPATGMNVLRTAPLSNGIPVVPRGAGSLIAAPAPEITEQMGDLLIPRRNEQGTVASTLYARRFTRPKGKNLLTLVVMDAGIDAQSLPLLVGLPPEVSVAFSPYARNPKPMIEALRNNGHEIWGMLPTMNSRYPKDDPGPLGLIGSMPKEELIRRLYNVMANTMGAAGLVLSPEESLSTQKEAFGAVMDEITKRGLFVLSTHPTRGIRQLTQNKDQIPMLYRADLLLDANPDKAVIESKLAGVVKEAEKSPNYVIVMSATPQTLEVVGSWLKRTALPSNTVLAPLSAVYAPIEAPPAPEPAAEGGHGSAAGSHGEAPAESSGHH